MNPTVGDGYHLKFCQQIPKGRTDQFKENTKLHIDCDDFLTSLRVYTHSGTFASANMLIFSRL